MRFTVKRAPDDEQGDDRRHRTLIVGPAITTVDKGADLQAAGNDALSLAGHLARIAVTITPDLIATAGKHCGAIARTGDMSDELTRGNWIIDSCRLSLSRDLDDDALTDYELARLYVTVPRNRERAWTDHLNRQIARLAAGITATFEGT